MVTNEDFYIFPEDLYRVGNSGSPRIEHLREDEVDTYPVNGITILRANGKGVSLFDAKSLPTLTLSGWAWKIKKGTVLPIGLKLWSDEDGHALIAPVNDLPIDEFKGILAKFVVFCEKVVKLPIKV